jgi:hypothetical protein
MRLQKKKGGQESLDSDCWFRGIWPHSQEGGSIVGSIEGGRFYAGNVSKDLGYRTDIWLRWLAEGI